MIDETAVVDRIRLYEVKIPLKDPFRISGGISFYRKSLIVVLSQGEFNGYGESAPFEEPYYSSETISSVKCLYKELLFDRIIDKEIKGIEDINKILNEGVRGNNFAKAGIENAYWDLICSKNKISLKELIEIKLKEMGVEEEFLESKDYIESGVSIGIPVDNDIATLKKWTNEFIDKGYRRIKIKIKPNWDIKPLMTVRDVIGDFPLWVDANSSYDFYEHKDKFKLMDRYNCLFYEQPLGHDDIIDHSKLAKYVDTPICLDESLKSNQIAKQVLEIEASRIWNIKVQRIGGLLECLKIYKTAVENDVSLWGGTMPESGIGAIPIMNLSSFKGFKFPADVEESERWYGPLNDLFEIKMNGRGQINVPKCAGIESIVDFDNLNRYSKLIADINIDNCKIYDRKNFL